METPELIQITDASNIYDNLYLDERHDLIPPDSIPTGQFLDTSSNSLNVLYEQEIELSEEEEKYSSLKEDNVILNSNATEDESVAVEALRQLGSGAVYTKIPHDSSLIICSNCLIRFQTTADFQTHLIICKQSQMRCYDCHNVHSVDFDNHHVCNALPKSHYCRLCNELFANKTDFLEHLQTHDLGNANHCKVCGAVFSRPSSLTNHMKIHMYQPGRAILNSSSIPESEVKSKPLPSLHINNWDEYDLTHDFNVDVNLGVGQEMTIDNFEEGDKSSDYEFVADISVKEEEITSTAVVDVKDLDMGKKKPYSCKYCQKVFAREKALLSHHSLHVNVLEKFLKCKHCLEPLKDEEALLKHNCVENSLLKDPLDEGRNVNKINHLKSVFYKHVCASCNKRFSTKQKLHRHMWIHRKKIFTCEICACSFEKQDELDTHRLSTHQRNSAYVCNECGKCFSSRQGLWEHNRVHSETLQVFKCTECTKTFTSRQGYLIHKRAHNDERPYGCRFCWKCFRDGGTLRKHERIHTGERPHACPICNRAFNQKVVLREHVRWLHAANEQPCEKGFYNCGLCELKLSDKDDLCAHIVKHSDQLAKDAAAKNVVNRSVDGSKLVGKLQDKVIAEVLPRIKIEVETNIEKLVECDLCGDKFLEQSDLAKHVTVHI